MLREQTTRNVAANARNFEIARFGSMVALSLFLGTVAFQFESLAAQEPRSSVDGLWTAVGFQETANFARAMAASELPMRQTRDLELFDLNVEALQRLAATATNEDQARQATAATEISEISVPGPDGAFHRFELIEAPVMSEALARKFPEIKSYRGQGIDDPLLTLRLDISPSGVHVQVLGPEGTFIVDPTPVENRYMTFNKRANAVKGGGFECLVQARTADGLSRPVNITPMRSGTELRTYRLAMACTGEYAQSFGGSTMSAMAAINTTVNRVTGIYERELAIRLVLVDNNDQIIFTNPNTDPFDNSNPNILINQSQATIDQKIGDANYDIGHTLSTGAGGLAGLGVVGESGRKARGVTGRNNPSGDAFDVDYVAHEVGHQFGGDHTFNGKDGSCSGSNRNPATAVEPGSGSTIQAYAGICRIDDLQPNSDPYFHSVSLDQIIAFSTLGAGNVVAPTATGNQIPTVDAGRDFSIPKGTPFKLTANGSDADEDRLLYCWEQRDLGSASNLTSPIDDGGPLFRSSSPSAEPTRVFPRWADILQSTLTPGEQLPNKTRTMNFRVTVRDNSSGGGGVNGDDVAVQVIESAGPFQMTAPMENTVSAPLIKVQWNVAGTDQSPINCQLVNIRLSIDGGQSFSTVLARNTKNDGEELVAIPGFSTSALRILVESSDNIFFACSPKTLSIGLADKQVFVVRHAEKQEGDDPDLTVTGTARANSLAQLLAPVGITHIFSTDVRRTRQTGEPTSIVTGVAIEIYASESDVIQKIGLLPTGSRVLVIGHSNTIGTIARGLGFSSVPAISESDFNPIFYIGLRSGTAITDQFKYEISASGIDESRSPIESRIRGLADNLSETTRLKNASRLLDQASRDEQATRTSAHLFTLDALAASNRPVVHLEQNWTSQESREFYHLRQGSPIMRRAFFNVLEQPDSGKLFRESAFLERFGFIPQEPHRDNPDGYPIGFSGDKSIEIACAACHTSRLTHNGLEYRIDGSQAMTDMESWLAELVLAIKLTLADAPNLEELNPSARIPLDSATKFGRFSRRLLEVDSPKVSQLRVIRNLLEQDYQRRQRYNDFNHFGRLFANDSDRANAVKHPQYGFGRFDALGAILNQATAEMIGVDQNASAANAPVNYPAIWDAPQHHHVQWNGAVDNTALYGPLGRNAGQVIGVFGLVDPGDVLLGYDSSINFDALNRAEELITKLWSPLWPDEFGVDRTIVSKGETVYRANCVNCHDIMSRNNPNRRANDVLVPITTTHGTSGLLGTDALVAFNWANRTARVGELAGRSVTLPFGEAFPNSSSDQVPSRDILTHLVFNAISRSFVPWREELTIDDAGQRTAVFENRDMTETLMRYKARPLNGVWSTAPYLHNGSVINMIELLTASEQRKSQFHVGTIEYEPSMMGFKDAGPFLFDTTVIGNSKAGHEYGTSLSGDDKRALLEFLKTL